MPGYATNLFLIASYFVPIKHHTISASNKEEETGFKKTRLAKPDNLRKK